MTFQRLFIYLFIETISLPLISQDLTSQAERMIKTQLQHCSLQLHREHLLKTKFIVY